MASSNYSRFIIGVKRTTTFPTRSTSNHLVSPVTVSNPVEKI